MQQDAAVTKLAAIVGDKYAIADAAEMAPYLVEWRGLYRGKARCVVRPGSTAEVAAVLALANAEGWQDRAAGRQHRPRRRADAA